MAKYITVIQIEAIGTIEQQVAAEFQKSYSKRLKFRYDISRNRLCWVVILNNDDLHASTHDTLEEAIGIYNEL